MELGKTSIKQMTDIEELELYNKYKESVPRQKQIMQEMEDDLQEAKAILINIEQELKLKSK